MAVLNFGIYETGSFQSAPLERRDNNRNESKLQFEIRYDTKMNLLFSSSGYTHRLWGVRERGKKMELRRSGILNASNTLLLSALASGVQTGLPFGDRSTLKSNLLLVRPFVSECL